MDTSPKKLALPFYQRVRHLKLFRYRRCGMLASCQPIQLSIEPASGQASYLFTHSVQVLETIFSTLSAHEVLLLAPVCQAWRAVAHSSLLWGERLGTRAAAACNLPKGEKQRPKHATGNSASDNELEGSLIADFGLASLGPAISLPTACLALHERNFLFNPCFKKTSALEAMFRPGGWVRN